MLARRRAHQTRGLDRWELVGKGCVLRAIPSPFPFGTSEVAIPKGTFVAGFGKGKWARGDEARDSADTNLMFRVTSDQDEVLFNGAMVSVRQLIMEQRKKDPEAPPAASP